MRDIKIKFPPPVIVMLAIWNQWKCGPTRPTRPESVKPRAPREYYQIRKDFSIQKLAAPSLMVSATKLNLILPRRTYGPYRCPQPLVVWAAYDMAINGPQASPGYIRVPWPFAFNRPFFAWVGYYSTWIRCRRVTYYNQYKKLNICWLHLD